MGQSGPGSMAPWCSVTSGPTRYVLGMQELFRGHSKTREFPAHSAKVHSVAWSCDGRRLASGSFDKTASVFLLEKDRLVSCWGPAQARERGCGKARCGGKEGGREEGGGLRRGVGSVACVVRKRGRGVRRGGQRVGVMGVKDGVVERRLVVRGGGGVQGCSSEM